ncbi:hypothetical protein XBLMG947_2597 [Xanthomonas bromi]|uniref:PadR family transcriptional regulator n=1 Tax=Xanthomonas bromi TaxID=56449 RepID=A0A1C3NN32_9XANT|nr:hypothetical protein XBLMG947_2597 [Xanthomonas bromi]
MNALGFAQAAATGYVELWVSGSPQRYYRITDSGRDCLRDWTAAWRATRDCVDCVLEGTHA